MTETRAVVAVPIYRRHLTEQEQISVRHLRAYLGDHDVVLVLPEGLESPIAGLREERFAADYFASISSYSQLLLSELFYRRFASYEMLLIYQLDCLVFADRLDEWCSTPYDYVGAPWLKDPNRPRRGFARVGNGGLSLRRTSQFLRVLTSRRYVEPRVGFWRDYATAWLPDLDGPSAAWRCLKRARVLRSLRRGVDWYVRHYTLNEDRFWADRAHLFYPDFKVAPVETALRFSFERAPRYCYERTGDQLPFGCHAWTRNDPAFWRPYLLSETCAAPS